MVSCECWAVAGESLPWKPREGSVGVLETLPGRWVRMQEATRPVIRSPEQGSPCVHTQICGILDESNPLFFTQEVSLYVQKCPLQLCTEWPKTGEKNTICPSWARWAHYTIAYPRVGGCVLEGVHTPGRGAKFFPRVCWGN